MAKLALLPVVLALAVLAAGIYGMVNNQISYGLAPVYFTELKFAQFAIPAADHNRWGAALVGWRASWWMGVLLGLPLALVALRLPGPTAYLRGCLRGIAIALLTGVLAALAGLALAYALPDLATELPLPKSSDPQGFYRAAMMHEGAYLGGVAGLGLALVSLWRPRRDI